MFSWMSIIEEKKRSFPNSSNFDKNEIKIMILKIGIRIFEIFVCIIYFYLFTLEHVY